MLLHAERSGGSEKHAVLYLQGEWQEYDQDLVIPSCCEGATPPLCGQTPLSCTAERPPLEGQTCTVVSPLFISQMALVVSAEVQVQTFLRALEGLTELLRCHQDHVTEMSTKVDLLQVSPEASWPKIAFCFLLLRFLQTSLKLRSLTQRVSPVQGWLISFPCV